MRAVWSAALLLGSAAIGAVAFAWAMASVPCDPTEPSPDPVPTQLRVMTAQSNACTYLGVRSGFLLMGALVLGASAVSLSAMPFLSARWRAGLMGLIVLASAFPAWMLFLFREWDPSCGPIATYLADCTHPPWILGPALVAGIATCIAIAFVARRRA